VNASFDHALPLSDPMGLPSIDVTISEFIEFHFEMTQELERLKVLAEKPGQFSQSEIVTQEPLSSWRRIHPDSLG